MGDRCHHGDNQDRGDQSPVRSQVEAGMGGMQGAWAVVMAVGSSVVGVAAAAVVPEPGLYPSGRRGILQLLHLQLCRDGRMKREGGWRTDWFRGWKGRGAGI